MTEYYKLLFDLSLYYTISGYYLMLATGRSTSVPIYLALIAAAGLDSLLRARRVYSRGKFWPRLIPLLLPLLALLFRPSLPQILQSLPAWLYLGFTMLTDRVDIDYNDFCSHFSFGLKLLLLMVFGPLFPERFCVSLLRSLPYLVIMLVSGVGLLRMLREQRPDGLRQGLYMGAFVLLCAALTLGKAPQLLAKGFGYLYQGVIAPLILLLAIAFAVLFYGFYLLASWLVSFMQGSQEPLELTMESMAETLGLSEEYTTYTANLRWLAILLAVFGAAVLILIVFLIFRRLLGEQKKPDADGPWRERVISGSSDEVFRKKTGILRPRDPRLAVRYYFARFVAESRRRGVSVPQGMTVTELSAQCADAFPDADPLSLAALYIPARYSSETYISPADAAQASELWHSLKQTKLPSKKHFASK